MKDKIKEILYKHSDKLTTIGIVTDADKWLWEGKFDEVTDDIVKLLESHNIRRNNSHKNAYDLNKHGGFKKK